MRYASLCRCHNPIHCVIPPFMLEKLAQSGNDKVRDTALENLQLGSRVRARRSVISTLSSEITGYEAVTGTPRTNRKVYDQGKRNPPDRFLPGKLVRSEGGPASSDVAVNEAYNYAGSTWQLYFKIFGRNSLDDKGMALVQTVHAGIAYDNAFWDGRQMVYGDGDGVIFTRFTKSPDVIAHELTHGVVQFTSRLEYYGESGALNEHFADVFGSLVRQYRKKQTAKTADWLIGKEILIPAPTRTALRSMKDPGTAYKNDPDIGSDPQPKHYKNRYKGTADSGGVHINSGIPNHAFYLAATAVGGSAWLSVGKVWYQVMLNLSPTSNFAACAKQCRQVSQSMAPQLGQKVADAVDVAWKAVGL
ncbi:MAG: M4 family metallopeptidase [Burkholderiales bacterium]